jgi:ABC-type sugar transport system ATPase subunit
VIYISHRLEEIFELADRVTVLRDGLVVGTRKVSETSQAELIRMMVGRTLDALFPPRSARRSCVSRICTMASLSAA